MKKDVLKLNYGVFNEKNIYVDIEYKDDTVFKHGMFDDECKLGVYNNVPNGYVDGVLILNTSNKLTSFIIEGTELDALRDQVKKINEKYGINKPTKFFYITDDDKIVESDRDKRKHVEEGNYFKTKGEAENFLAKIEFCRKKMFEQRAEKLEMDTNIYVQGVKQMVNAILGIQDK